MISSIRKFWQGLWRSRENPPVTTEPPAHHVSTVYKDIGDASDPFVAYALTAPGMIDLDSLSLRSRIVDELRDAGVKLTVPLVSHGELIGLLNLGPRLSEQEYSQDDRQLLNALAVQATPALRLAQMAHQRQAEAQERERIEHELQVARIIQQTLLPRQLPHIEGYRLAVHWQPARAVGGDFYDFIQFADGRIGIVIADVTDKGVPAALVMASARSVLRASAERQLSPSAVLAEANNLLVPDMPAHMFVTCLYAVFNPINGRLRYANAGYNLPYLRKGEQVVEMRATGLPLGLLPDMRYEENETYLDPGNCVLFHSDGLVEAHNPDGEMFGFPRLQNLLSTAPCSSELIEFLKDRLADFTGDDWEQEDDVTLLTLENIQPEGTYIEREPKNTFLKELKDWVVLGEFSLPSIMGNEREALQRVEALLEPVGLAQRQMDRLKTAVAEATMNAIEHGNKFDPNLATDILVRVSPLSVSVQITDFGGGAEHQAPVENPDIDAKLRGEQSSRGWGLFLIENMVDGMMVSIRDGKHTVDLVMILEGDQDADTRI